MESAGASLFAAKAERKFERPCDAPKFTDVNRKARVIESVGFQHINHVRDHSQAKGNARLVLIMLATRVNENGYCHPSYKRLAHDTGLSVSTVQRALKKIPPDELEIVEHGGSPKAGVRSPTKYRIVIRNHSQIDHSRQPRAKRKNGNDCSQIDHSDCSHSDTNYSQNGHSDCSQLDHLTAKAEQNKEQQRLTAHNIATPGDSRSVPAPVTPKKKAYVLSDEALAELQRKYHRLGDIRRFIPEAAAKCAEKFPAGGPMRRQYFEQFLATLESDLDPPGLIEGQKIKAEMMVEAARDREENKPRTEEPLPSPPLPPQEPLVPKPRLVQPEPTDPDSLLKIWKETCPQLASDFERAMGELKAQSEWNANAFERRCGEIFHRHLRQTIA